MSVNSNNWIPELKAFFNRKVVRIITGLVIGGGLGFSYYYFIGCSSGTCPITSNPYGSILWGSLFGITIFYK